jgi:hypothetical protein
MKNFNATAKIQKKILFSLFCWGWGGWEGMHGTGIKHTIQPQENSYFIL